MRSALRERIQGLPPWLRLPLWLALVRACTAGQVARFLCEGDLSAAYSILEMLVQRRGYVSVVGPITLPIQCGPARKKRVLVYYRTEKGFGELNRVAPELVRHAKPGRPKGALLDRLPHDLLIAESWLWQEENGREILEFLPETELKRQLLKRRLADDSSSAVLPTFSEATGDFKMLLRDRETAAEFWIQGEAAVRYSSKQIAEKPDFMDWFCCDRGWPC